LVTEIEMLRVVFCIWWQGEEEEKLASISMEEDSKKARKIRKAGCLCFCASG
jgi:hypothetical protein